MLLIQQLVHQVRRLPLAMLLGLALMAVGGVLDVAIHLEPAAHHPHGAFASEHMAHVVGIAGMALVLAGLVAHGVRRQRRPRAASHQGGFDSHANR